MEQLALDLELPAMAAAWNTGRLYQRDGQKIAAMTVSYGALTFVCFTDDSRMIDGSFIATAEDVASPAALQRAVMRAYDTPRGCNYSHGVIEGERFIPLLSQEQRAQLGKLARAVPAIERGRA